MIPSHHRYISPAESLTVRLAQAYPVSVGKPHHGRLSQRIQGARARRTANHPESPQQHTKDGRAVVRLNGIGLEENVNEHTTLGEQAITGQPPRSGTRLPENRQPRAVRRIDDPRLYIALRRPPSPDRTAGWSAARTWLPGASPPSRGQHSALGDAEPTTLSPAGWRYRDH